MLSKKKYLEFDLYRFTGIEYNFLSFIKKLIFNPGYRYVYFYRNASFYSKKNIVRWFFWFFLRRMQLKYAFQISDRTKIGYGFYIGHIGPIVISHNSIIGNNCNINHGVTIGEASRGPKKGAPKIGNNVWFGTNSIVVGKIKIGHNVLIAPGSFVNFNVPDDSIVIGNPGKIIPKKNATKHYIKRIKN